jgi:TonB family protein
MSRRFAVALLLAPGGLVAAPPAALAQTRAAELLRAARQHIAAAQLDSADAELGAALESAAYVMDSVNVFVWRGILAHLRGRDSLARTNFRSAITLNPGTSVRGLDQIAPGLAELFDAEVRAASVYPTNGLDEPPARRSGPAVAYPPELRRRRVAGRATVQFIVDTLGSVEEQSITVLDTPDAGFVDPLKQALLATTFTPGRLKGHAVRTTVFLSFNLTPPQPPNPTALARLAREQLAARRVDSALALLQDALDTVTQATEGERVYALLVQGLAFTAQKRDSLASAAFDTALAGYRALTARGVDLAPFLRRLADSVRMSRRHSGLEAPSAVGVDEQPALLTHPPIRYAAEMQALRIGGTVVVEAALDTTGHVVPATVRIVQSPNPVFNAEARRIVVAATYRPARIGGRPVRAVIRQPITFAPY